MEQGTRTPKSSWKCLSTEKAKNKWMVFTISKLFTVIKNKADSKELIKEALLLRDWISPFILVINKKRCKVTYMEKNNSIHRYMMHYISGPLKIQWFSLVIRKANRMLGTVEKEMQKEKKCLCAFVSVSSLQFRLPHHRKNKLRKGWLEWSEARNSFHQNWGETEYLHWNQEM